jgi:hypothetical protein
MAGGCSSWTSSPGAKAAGGESDYIPHTLMDGDRAAANVSANLIRTSWRGEEKRFFRLAPSMTTRPTRGHGLAGG